MATVYQTAKAWNDAVPVGSYVIVSNYPRGGTCFCAKTTGEAYHGFREGSYVPVEGMESGVPLEYVKEDISQL